MGMKKLRRDISPLSSDSAAPLNLPPVRTGLLTKLNLLTVGLIVLAALATSGFYFARLWYYEDDDLRARGAAIVSMLAAISERGVYPADDTHTERILDSLAADSEVAYVSVQDTRQNVLAERRFAAALGHEPLPPLPPAATLPAAGKTAERLGYGDVFIQTEKHMLDDHTPFLEQGIPAVDIIDFDYPYWHTTEDTVDKVSAESLHAVGDTLWQWVVEQSKP